MWIKICANTSLEDALLASQLGADAVGFVFAPSVRRVTPEQVARIAPHLPASVERIGVFPALEAEEIVRIVEVSHLDAVQLHGGFDLALLRRLRALLPSSVNVIQTVSWTAGLEDPSAAAHSAAAVAEQVRNLAACTLVTRVLVDSRLGAATGGTGVSFDWSAARAVLRGRGDGPGLEREPGPGLDLIVAGGLNPENVTQAITQLNPWGVDVASGVESSPGRKSPERLADFIQSARACKSGD